MDGTNVTIMRIPCCDGICGSAGGNSPALHWQSCCKGKCRFLNMRCIPRRTCGCCCCKDALPCSLSSPDNLPNNTTNCSSLPCSSERTRQFVLLIFQHCIIIRRPLHWWHHRRRRYHLLCIRMNLLACNSSKQFYHIPSPGWMLHPQFLYHLTPLTYVMLQLPHGIAYVKKSPLWRVLLDEHPVLHYPYWRERGKLLNEDRRGSGKNNMFMFRLPFICFIGRILWASAASTNESAVVWTTDCAWPPPCPAGQ